MRNFETNMISVDSRAAESSDNIWIYQTLDSNGQLSTDLNDTLRNPPYNEMEQLREKQGEGCATDWTTVKPRREH